MFHIKFLFSFFTLQPTIFTFICIPNLNNYLIIIYFFRRVRGAEAGVKTRSAGAEIDPGTI